MAEQKKKTRGATPAAAPRSRQPEEPDDLEVPEYRRRSRPVRVRRRRWDRFTGLLSRLSLRGILRMLAVVAVILLVRYLVLGGTTFRLASSDQIGITGAEQVPREQVLDCFASDLGRNIFYISLHQRRQQIESIPWVRSASVLRLWPGQIEVRLTERKPVAFAREGSSIGLVDAQGVLLAPPRTAHYNFAVLTGLAGTHPVSGSPAMVEARARQVGLYLLMKRALDRNGSHHSTEFSEIDLRDPSDLRTTLTLNGDPTAIVIHFGHEHFLARYQLLAAHLKEWQASFTHLTSIDLRYDGQAIINTGAGTAGVDVPGVSPAE